MSLLDVSELFRVHASFVARVLRRAGVAERDLCDATQEVFLVVQRRAQDFEGRSQPRTWLYRIAWNVASETRRRAFRRHELLDGTEEPEDLEPCALERLEARERLDALRAAVAELDADKREALVHAELDERPLNELAARRGIPLKTAFSRLYAARRALQRALREQGVLCAPWWPFAQLRTWLRSKTFGWAAAGALAALLVPPMPPFAPQLQAAEPRGAAPALRCASVVLLEPTLVIASSPAPKPMRPPRARAQLRSEPPPPQLPLPSPMRVVRTGAADLGFGPFGESSLANPPLVAPQRHPRAKLAMRTSR